MLRKEGTGKIPAALAFAVVAGLAVTVIGAVISASLIHAQTISEGAAGIAAMITILFGAMISSVVAAGKVPGMRFIMCLAGGAAYFLALVCCAAIVFDGVKAGSIPSLAVAAAGSMVVYLLGMRGGRKPKYKVPKLRL